MHKGWQQAPLGCRGIEEFRDYEALLFSLLFWPSNVSPKDAHVLILETVNMTLCGKKDCMWN